MAENLHIRHAFHDHVDMDRWDRTVTGSPNGTIYGLSWYLNAVCPGWEALVTDDYRFIMPLTWRKKTGIHYLFQPLLSQQLGIFSPETITPGVVLQFISAVPARFRFAEIKLNSGNPVVSGSFTMTIHRNCRLDLSSPYSVLEGSYTDNVRRNLKRSQSYGLKYEEECPSMEYLGLVAEDKGTGGRILLSRRNRASFSKLIDTMTSRNTGSIRGIRSSHGNLVAAVLTGFSNGVHYYLAPASNPEGRESRAMFHLVDRMIRNGSGNNQILDFEGSDIDSIARFYTGFGAVAETYPALRFYRLPFLLRTLAEHRYLAGKH